MKKFILALTAVICMASFSFAQDKKGKTKGAVPSAKTVQPKKVTAAPAGPLKKDGTPDMRYKANKAKPGPLKKDGTPDMRYKANKKKG
jgi:hypothetical protein